MTRPTVTLAAVVALTLALAAPALAHARFVSSTPSPGQAVSAAPASVAITFTEELKAGSTGSVADASGATVSTGATINANDRTKLSIALKSGLPNGVYKVSWHSISADDGDELDGSFFFGVGVPASSTSTASSFPALAAALATGGLALLAVSLRALLPRRQPA